MAKTRGRQILGWLLLGLGLAWEVYEWAVVNEGVRYFAGDYHRIVLLLIIVAVGAPIMLGFVALPGRLRRRIALWLIGAIAAGTTVFAFWCGYQMVRLTGF